MSDILAARSMKHASFPELDEILDSATVDEYPMRKTFDEAANDTFLILHSSGTTGLPKPLRITHGQIAANYYISQLPEECDCGGPDFRRISIVRECAGRLMVPFVPFHVISAVVGLYLSVFGQTTLVFGPADRLMTATDLLDAIEYGNCSRTFCSPALLEKFAASKADVLRLARLSAITYGGGMYLMPRLVRPLTNSIVFFTAVLSPQPAKILSSSLPKTKFVQFFGSTETGMWCLYHLGPQDMDYLSIDACHLGVQWRPVAGTGEAATQSNGDSESRSDPMALHEAVIVRSDDPVLASRQAVFHVFPDLTEYSTGDLFAPHPIRAHTWKFAGRADDLIVFSRGIKFRPAGIEAKIQQGHDRIREVLMWGDRHQQAILLVELNEAGLKDMESEQGRVATKLRLDMLIDEANLEAPVVAQIAKTHVVFATKEKPLPRTSKGSVKRKEAANIYEAEIEEVYRLHGVHMSPMMSRVQ